jgi:hypothetical protein
MAQKMDTLFVDFVLSDREKSWEVKIGDTTAFLAKSLCERVAEFQFIVPKWLIKKIEAAA